MYSVRSRGRPARGDRRAWGLGEGLTTPHRKKHLVRIWTDTSEQHRQRKMRMGFGTRNFGSLYVAGSLKTVSGELAKCNLDLVAVQEVT
jgi:hypothetical protein